jgi:hypothetical protein
VNPCGIIAAVSGITLRMAAQPKIVAFAGIARRLVDVTARLA